VRHSAWAVIRRGAGVAGTEEAMGHDTLLCEAGATPAGLYLLWKRV